MIYLLRTITKITGRCRLQLVNIEGTTVEYLDIICVVATTTATITKTHLLTNNSIFNRRMVSVQPTDILRVAVVIAITVTTVCVHVSSGHKPVPTLSQILVTLIIVAIVVAYMSLIIIYCHMFNALSFIT